jgi:transposase
LTWAEIGVTPTLIEAPKGTSSTGLGFLTVTPKRNDIAFRFNLIPYGLDTEECIYWLKQIHAYYHKKVIMVWDNLSAHYAAQLFFEMEHPEWFEFHYLPTYSPELNPVEQCWHHTKGVGLANFVAYNKDELAEKLFETADCINNDKQLLASFFKHAGLKL